MRSVLRRLLWLGPALVLITMVTFGLLSLSAPPRGGAPRLPLFFNPEPGRVEPVARAALAAVAAAPGGNPAAAAELARLGGAALPYVLPALDSLSPEGRARVVRTLRPVAARMGLELDERWDASREVLFWTRFWEEHSIDYRPIVARRAVLRLVRKSTLLRDAEVRQLDTYALDELMRQLGKIEDGADVERVRLVTDIALDMLGGPPEAGLAWRVPPGASPREARAVASAWSAWWGLHRSSFESYSGADRLTAMLRDTRYGAWVTQAVRYDLGFLPNGRAVGEVLREGALVSAPLLACGIAGAGAAAALGGLGAALADRRLRRWLSALLLVRAALPVAALAALASFWLGGAARELWLGALILALGGAPLSAMQAGARLETRGSQFPRTLESLGVARFRVALATLRLSGAALVVQLGARLSTLITLTFVVEWALGLPGLGAQTIDALEHRDLNWLMAITICTALFVGLLAALSDVLLGLLEPRWRGSVERLGGAA